MLNFTGSMIGLGAVAIVGGGLLVLTHEAAVKSCNTEWEFKLEKAKLELEAKIAVQNAEIKSLDEALVRAVVERKKIAEEHKQKLEKQREEIALSESCNLCRIPRDRLWLRKSTSGADISPHLYKGTSIADAEGK